MKKVQNCLLITAIAVLFNSCTKDGATGPAGTNGTNGNANVETTLFLNQYLPNPGSLTLTDSAITQSVMDKGAIIVYYRLTGFTNWVTLPDYNLDVDIESNGTVIITNRSNSLLVSNTFDIKVVVIPSS